MSLIKRPSFSARASIATAWSRTGPRLPDGWQLDRRRLGRGRQQGPHLCLQPRRTPDDRVRPRRQFLAELRRRLVLARAWPAHRRRRQSLLHRRWRSHRAQMHDRRQGAAHHRHPQQARAVHERRAVSPLHPHRAVAEGRDLRFRRLRQCARAQIHAGRKADQKLGRTGQRSRPVQHRAQHRDRRRRLGLRRRPREPSRAGVRRQRQIRDAVEQSAPSLRAVLLRRARIRISSSASSDRACRSISRCPISVRA